MQVQQQSEQTQHSNYVLAYIPLQLHHIECSSIT